MCRRAVYRFSERTRKITGSRKGDEPPCLESPAGREAVRIHAHPFGIPLGYFNTSLQPFPSEALAVSPWLACEQAQPTILQSAEWEAFQAFCQQAEVDLTQSLQNLERSWTKSYLLGEEKESVQDYLRAGVEQVQVVCQVIKEITSYPTEGNWQRLKQALDKLTKISAMAAPSPESQAGEINTPPPTAWLARAWEEVQYFLGPVIVTGWGMLNKLGLLTEALTKNVPIVGGLTSLMLTLYQRIIVGIRQLKTEDQDQLIAVCHALTAAFDPLKGNQMIEHIQAQTNNTVIAAQGALSAAQQARETKQVVQNQSQIIDTLIEDHAALRAELKHLIKKLRYPPERYSSMQLKTKTRSRTNGESGSNKSPYQSINYKSLFKVF